MTAGYSWAPEPPVGWPPRPKVRSRAAPIVLLVVLVLAGAGGIVAIGAARSSQQSFPARWDPRIAPIAAEVANLRGLAYKHAVPVRFLSSKAFENQVGVDQTKLTAKDRAEVRREEHVDRALGLIDGKVDLLKAIDAESRSSTLAYYDPDKKEIVVRGTTIDVVHRVTLAHELTHVLQDQYFDLVKLEKRAAKSDTGDEGAVRAILEGDAVRIEEKYTAELSKADQRENDREQAAANAPDASTASVPDAVQFFFGAPYIFGPPTMRILEDVGGNTAVNDAFKGSIPSTRIFVVAGRVDNPELVPPLALPAGAIADGTPDSFGAFETYVTLAPRIDPVRALKAADVIVGGRAVAFRKGTKSCYGVALAVDRAARLPFLVDALRRWAKTMPDATAGSSNGHALLTTCDPGSRATAPAHDRFTRATNLLEVRTGITEEAVKNGASLDDAQCAARVFVQGPGILDLVMQVGNGTPNAETLARIQTAVSAARDACDSDPNAGLP